MILNKAREEVVGASLFVPVRSEDLYEVLLNVQGFPRWAPGVRRVEIIEGPMEPGMVSEWEVSILGLRRRVSSVLVEAEPSALLRWSYEGPVRGWGECVIRERGDGTLASFAAGVEPGEPGMASLMRTAPLQSAARLHLKRSLARLGKVISGEDERVRVGPLERV